MKAKIILSSTLVGIGLLMLFLRSVEETAAANQINTDLGYGFNVAEIDIARVQELGFNWVKIFGPPGVRFDANVMIRIDINSGDAENLDGVGNRIREIAEGNHAYIEAYEIGNEVNLDASYGWTTSPDAAAYVDVLCRAYDEIKRVDSDAIVISAGLAPVGRVPDTWEGHLGHNGLYQDDREFLKEMIAAGAGDCLDAVGYHNYGFDADFDAEPDVIDESNNCSNGFCFRGVEKIYEIMAENGLGDKDIWTTEYGWIIDPAEVDLADCASDPTMAGRQWQFVTLEEQAENLVGSFTYAAENYPWMGGMIIFNLNFNEASYYQDCEQMRFYSVAGRPAEEALKEMPKAYEQKVGELSVTTNLDWTMLAETSSQPLTQTFEISLTNVGDAPVTFTLSSNLSNTLQPGFNQSTGVLLSNESTLVTSTLTSTIQTSGVYTGTIGIDVFPEQEGYPIQIPIRLTFADTLRNLFLATITR